jgi:hypothetical protein
MADLVTSNSELNHEAVNERLIFYREHFTIPPEARIPDDQQEPA